MQRIFLEFKFIIYVFPFKMNFIKSGIIESFIIIIISQDIVFQHSLLDYASFIEWLNPNNIALIILK
jgi:hypothetical protein